MTWFGPVHQETNSKVASRSRERLVGVVWSCPLGKKLQKGVIWSRPSQGYKLIEWRTYGHVLVLHNKVQICRLQADQVGAMWAWLGAAHQERSGICVWFGPAQLKGASLSMQEHMGIVWSCPSRHKIEGPGHMGVLWSYSSRHKFDGCERIE